MGAFLVYTFKVAICLLLFFVFVKLAFGNDTFHRFNRAAWLSIIPLSLIIPLFNFKFLKWMGWKSESMEAVELAQAEEVSIGSIASGGDETSISLIVSIAVAIWLLGAIAVGLTFLVSYFKMFRTIHSGGYNSSYAELVNNCKDIVKYSGDVRLSVVECDIPPFSWMNYIVISKKDIDEDGREILLHEISHIKAKHSIDMIFIDLMIVFQWFNPASYLIKRSLQQVHEYCADDSVIEAGVDGRKYQLLLIKKAVGQRLYTMANSFNHSKLKNRITMMLKEKSSRWGYAKCLYALPLLLIAATAFASPEMSSTFEDISNVKFTQNSPIKDTVDKKNGNAIDEVVVVSYGDKNNSQEKVEKEEVYQYAIIEEKPTFNGGNPGEFSKWVAQNLIYPDGARKNKTAGRLIYQFTIGKDGKLSNIKEMRANITGDKSKAHLLKEEAMRVLLSSPAWTPGKKDGKTVDVVMIFPIIFQVR